MYGHASKSPLETFSGCRLHYSMNHDLIPILCDCDDRSTSFSILRQSGGCVERKACNFFDVIIPALLLGGHPSFVIKIMLFVYALRTEINLN